MKYRTIFYVLLAMASAIDSAAQSKPGGGSPSQGRQVDSPDRSMPRLPDPRTDGPDTLPKLLYVSGRVVTDDGAPISDRALIQSNCEGTVKTEGYTDKKGAFSIDFGNTRNRALSEAEPASDTSDRVIPPTGMRENAPRDWRKCELKAVLSGFTSKIVDLGTNLPAFGNVNIGNIVLHRMAPVGSSTISANTAQAPDGAQKNYGKGLDEKKKGNLDSAQQEFRKAVDAYPQYAVAWLELGRVQIQKKDIASARQSFHQSIAADAKLIGPYQELAQLAAREKQWQEVADTTDQLLKLNSVNFPEFWFYNCVSKYQLGNLDAAEYSALQGVKIDTEHRVPKMEYVLGTILEQKHDYIGAAQHLHNYLILLPNGPDAAEAKKKLDEVEKLR